MFSVLTVYRTRVNMDLSKASFYCSNIIVELALAGLPRTLLMTLNDIKDDP